MSVLLLSPAGSFESLSAALANGADAVYFGVGSLNMRSRATVNFTIEDLPEVVKMCRSKGAKAWLTLNTVVFDDEFEELKRIWSAAAAAGVDAVIAADPAVMKIARDASRITAITATRMAVVLSFFAPAVRFTAAPEPDML